MFIDKLIATGPGLVGIVVIGFIGHVPLLCIAAVDGIVIAVTGVVHIVNEWDEEHTQEINQRKSKRDSNQNVSPLEVRVEVLESRDKKKDSEIQAMKQEIEQLKLNGKLSEQSFFASKRRAVNGLLPNSPEPSNDPDISSGVDGKSKMSGIK